jgi:hypothetical protein
MRAPSPISSLVKKAKEALAKPFGVSLSPGGGSSPLACEGTGEALSTDFRHRAGMPPGSMYCNSTAARLAQGLIRVAF